MDLTELPKCTVCLERMDESVNGVLTTLCNHSFHSQCLQWWEDTSWVFRPSYNLRAGFGSVSVISATQTQPFIESKGWFTPLHIQECSWWPHSVSPQCTRSFCFISCICFFSCYSLYSTLSLGYKHVTIHECVLCFQVPCLQILSNSRTSGREQMLWMWSAGGNSPLCGLLCESWPLGTAVLIVFIHLESLDLSDLRPHRLRPLCQQTCLQALWGNAAHVCDAAHKPPRLGLCWRYVLNWKRYGPRYYLRVLEIFFVRFH